MPGPLGGVVCQGVRVCTMYVCGGGGVCVCVCRGQGVADGARNTTPYT